MHLFPLLSLQILFSPLLHSSAVFRNQKIRTVSPPHLFSLSLSPPPSLSSLQGKQQQIEPFVSDVLRGYNTKQC